MVFCKVVVLQLFCPKMRPLRLGEIRCPRLQLLKRTKPEGGRQWPRSIELYIGTSKGSGDLVQPHLEESQRGKNQENQTAPED